MSFSIEKIEFSLPKKSENNKFLKLNNKKWDIKAIENKTGIKKRYISNTNEDVLYLALSSVKKIIKKIDKDKIDFIIFVSQTYKKNLTSASCIIQEKCLLRKKIIAIDLNIGCSGFIYALYLSKLFIKDRKSKYGLIVCSDTYTKNIGLDNKSTKPIFSDGSASVLISKSRGKKEFKFDFGSDGSGSSDLLILSNNQKKYPYLKKDQIYMNGGKIALFAMNVVPQSIKITLQNNKMKKEDIDMFIFHQASKYVIDNLIRIVKIPKNKVFVNYKNIGNTISSSIPIALKEANKKKMLKNNSNIMLIGFGVGLSWGSTIIKWKNLK